MPEHLALDNAFVIMISVIGAAGLFAMTLVIMVILAYNRDKEYQRERILLGLAASSALFSFMNIIPIGYNKFALLNTTGYIVVRGIWFLAKYMMAAYEIFVLIATIYGIRSRATLSRRMELTLHFACLVLGMVTLVTWLTRAFVLLETDDPTKNAAKFYVDIANQFAVFCEVWLGLVLFALLLWIYVQTKLCSVRSYWLRNTITFDLIDEDPDKQVGKNRLDNELENAHKLVGPLQAYVLLFLLFAIPAGFLGIKCSHFDDCSLALEMILSWRSLAFAFVYFFRRETRKLVDAYTIARLLTRRFLTKASPDDTGHGQHLIASALYGNTSRSADYMMLPDPTGSRSGGDLASDLRVKCAQQPYQLFTEELMLDQD